MTSPDAASVEAQVRGLLADAADSLERRGLDPATGGLVRALRDPMGIDGVLRLSRDAGVVADVLRDVADRVCALERIEEERDPFGDVAWAARRRRLADERDPARYRARWVALWVEALTVSRWERADEAADLAGDTDTDLRMQADMRDVSRAFATGRRADALPALAALTTSATRGGGDPATVVPLVVLRARIHLRDMDDTTAAEHAARHAVDAAGTAAPDPRALAVATLAEVHVARGDLAAAVAALEGIRDLPTSCPDPLVVAGMLAERRSPRGPFDELYDAAVERAGIDAARPFVLRPTPPNLLWRAARSVSTSAPGTARGLIESALSGRVVGGGETPDRRARVDHGRILRALGERAAAAAAFVAAGHRYASSGRLSRAVSLYEQAHHLAPDDPEVARNLAEAWRVQAEDEDAVVDRALAGRALELVADPPPAAAPPEVRSRILRTRAMLEHSLDPPGADPVLLLERALLLDDSAAHTWTALAAMLRLRGRPVDAVTAGRRAVARDPRDPFAMDALVAALADAGDVGAALRTARLMPGPTRGSPLPLRVGLLHLRSGTYQLALDEVAAEPESDTVHLIRGTAHELAGDRVGAAAEYERVRSGAGTCRRNRAWACLRLGDVDEAVRQLTELAADRPRDDGFALDHGLALVRHGDLDDGARALREAVTACTVVAELVHLIRVDAPLVRTDLARGSGDDQATTVLDAAVGHAERRCTELRNGRADGLAGLAERARTARDQGRTAEAVTLYRELAASGRVPEAFRAAGRLQAASALSALLAGDTETAAGLLDDVALLTDRVEVLWPAYADVVPAPTRTGGSAVPGPAAAGRFRDAVAGLTAERGFSDVRDELDRIAVDLTGRAHRCARADVPDAAVFPIVTPIEVVLPRALAALETGPALPDGVSRLRDALTAECGVRIPGVRVQVDDAPGVTVRIYDQTACAAGPPDVGDPLAFVLDALGVAARDNLYRLLAPVDVLLWFDVWTRGDAPAPPRPVDGPSRLRLVRVLRLLLRENVPVTDRNAIMTGFHAAERDGSRGPLDTLRRVRQRLPATVLGAAPGTVAEALPTELEQRVRAGLVDGRAEWTADRAATRAIVAGLRSWREAVGGPVVVTVHDAEVRPFVWRLLAAGRVRVPVLADEEIR